MVAEVNRGERRHRPLFVGMCDVGYTTYSINAFCNAVPSSTRISDIKINYKLDCSTWGPH